MNSGDPPDPGTQKDGHPTSRTHIRLLGRTLNHLVALAPWLWPLLRGPMARYFDSRADGWDERTDAPGPSHLAPLAVAVTKIDRRPERVLEIGTGTGVGALFVSREFPLASVRGVDISERMVREAQAKIGLDRDARVAFKVADAADLPYPEDHFDLVCQLNMPPFFGETGRVLRHGGYVIVAASSGDRTPFFTPDALLERGFKRHGFVSVSTGRIGNGSYFVARKGE